jgi:carnitine monooxygenase subunit
VIPVKSLDWPDAAPERARTLPARYFYDEEIFKAERERIFYPAWHCVGHVNELAEPGQFLTFDILDQTIVVLHGDDGVIRAFHNVCQHRGNRLLEARRGKLGSLLRCGYHSWCYGRDGGLKSAPRSERLPDFDRKEYGLKGVRTEILGSFVFVNFDPDAAPLAEIGKGVDATMSAYLPDRANMTLIEEVDVVVPANWKIIMDNSIEGYHFGLSGPVHKELAALIEFKQYSLEAHDKWWSYIGPPKPGATAAYGAPLAGATWQTDSFFNIGIWPNILLLPVRGHLRDLPHDPVGAGEVAAALRLLRPAAADAGGDQGLHQVDEREAGARGHPAQHHAAEGPALLRLQPGPLPDRSGAQQ